jgi:hypothetical protein
MPEYRGSIGGNSVLPAKDFDAATAGSIKKGDLVTLDATGKVVKLAATSANVLGVSEGINPQTDYEKNNNIEKHKVRTSLEQVVSIGYSSTAPIVGTSYAILVDAGVQKLNTGAAVAGEVKTLKVVDVKSSRGEAYVVIATGALE